MAANNNVEKILSNAKETLKNAEESRTLGNPGKLNPEAYAPKPTPNEFSLAPYKVAHESRKASMDQEAKSLGEGLKARQEQVKKIGE